MKTVIEDRLAPYRKILEGAWEVADEEGIYGLTDPIIDYALQALNAFEDWIISTAPDASKAGRTQPSVDAASLAELMR